LSACSRRPLPDAVRILFVCMPGSIHAARWIRQLRSQGWDLHAYGAIPTAVCPAFEDVTIHSFSRHRPRELSESVRLRGVWPLAHGAWHAGMPFARVRPRRLARLIERLRPDVVHSLEFQCAGYLTIDAKRHVRGRFPSWIATNWGSDVHWFSRFPEHERRIRAILQECDFYTCECHRDVVLARRLGLTKPVPLVSPNAGGIDVDEARRMWACGRVSSRRLIAVKGYDNWHGRGLVAMRAVELAGDALSGYEVAVTSAAPTVASRAAELRAQGLKVTVLPSLPHRELLRLYGRARVALALSVTDGLSTSTLEAVAMGAFPVQSSSSCLDEWVNDGETGLLIDAEDAEGAAAALGRALADDRLVDAAAEANAAVVSERLDERILQPRAIELYRIATV
jgi:glycosyltransferase involved in cell wall biosynthesis